MSQLVHYLSHDDRSPLDLSIEGRTAWLIQLEIAELFQTTMQTGSLHVNNIFEDYELADDSVVKESLTVDIDGMRDVQLTNPHYNLTRYFWRARVDLLLVTNDQPLLDGPGTVSHSNIKAILNERYDTFDANRRQYKTFATAAEALKAHEDWRKKLNLRREEI